MVCTPKGRARAPRGRARGKQSPLTKKYIKWKKKKNKLNHNRMVKKYEVSSSKHKKKKA